jgi:hypothetical protein
MRELALKPQYDYFLQIRESLLPEKEGKFVVIVGKEVVGTYDSAPDAVRESAKKYPIGTFLIQKVVSDMNSLVQKFASPIVCFCGR